MDASHVYLRALALGCFYSHISTRTFRRALTATLDSYAEIECPFSGVTKSGRVWRKVPESDARSVRGVLTLTLSPYPDGSDSHHYVMAWNHPLFPYLLHGITPFSPTCSMESPAFPLPAPWNHPLFLYLLHGITRFSSTCSMESPAFPLPAPWNHPLFPYLLHGITPFPLPVPWSHPLSPTWSIESPPFPYLLHGIISFPLPAPWSHSLSPTCSMESPPFPYLL